MMCEAKLAERGVACMPYVGAPKAQTRGGGEFESGQGTVEFALVTAAFLCVALGLAAVWHLLSDGVVVQHAVTAASHHVEGALSAAADLFVY